MSLPFLNFGNRESQRLISVGFTALIHLALFLVLASGLTIHPLGQISHDLKVAIIAGPGSEASSPPPPPFRDPMLLNVLPPDFVINQDPPPDAENSEAASEQFIAPRPDPSRPNAYAPYPADFIAPDANKTVIVILKVFVLKDGMIRDCVVAGSSGLSKLDITAVDFVKTHWRFLPASLDGKPVEDWTTVEVTFGPPI